MNEIYVSYHSKDSALVKQLAGDLAEREVKVFWDSARSADDTSVTSTIQMQAALLRSDYVLVVISPSGMGARYVDEEWRTALEDGKWVIPIYARTTPEIPAELASQDILDFRNLLDYMDRFEELIVRLYDSGYPLAFIPDSRERTQKYDSTSFVVPDEEEFRKAREAWIAKYGDAHDAPPQD